MQARSFLYVSLGILALAFAYHFGARNATAQAAGASVVGITNTLGLSASNVTVVCANGDVYGASASEGPWRLLTNVFSGPTPAQPTTFGAIKAKYRP
jgi:hypothetical protein